MESKYKNDIWFSTNDNARLSNLYVRQFYGSTGLFYQSVEHAYQSNKSGKFDRVTYNNKVNGKWILTKPKKVYIKDDYNIRLMRSIMLQSFKSNIKEAEYLISTYPTMFTHVRGGGIWRDKFPALLHSVRAELTKLYR